MLDAEHFFDGFKNNRKYSIDTLKRALQIKGLNGLYCVTQMEEHFPMSFPEIINEVIKTSPEREIRGSFS